MKTLTPYIIPLSLCFLSACAQEVIPPEKSLRSVEVLSLHSESYYAKKQFSGVIQSVQSSDLSFRVPGVIEKIYVKEGQAVKKGQLLAHLDPHDFNVHLSELNARNEEAEAAYDLAKIELSRVQQATDDDAIAKINLDRAISTYKRSKAMLDVMQKNIEKGTDALAYTELKAPFDGVIATQRHEQFEQILPGISIFTLHQLDALEAVIDVPENMMSQFSESQKATVNWQGNDAKIDAILVEKSTNPDLIKQTYSVTFNLQSAPANILPGKSITLSININQPKDSFCLPYSAIVGDKAGQFLLTVEEGKVKQLPVSIEQYQAQSVCVKGALEEGQAIIVTGASYMNQGDAVGPLLFVTR
ncbi:hemolysin D [Psychromonas marina]|uniref:Hemolysin D n=1 Tax=Psychromonas marina TaxID=88364 RepID=A0ABQ6E435_9GAMM|nr:efflux RND transporter periplasmic adaptor subunit [Psychromonas marina]GLS92106.1 hemolysin D [Psychromonas marina]